MARQLKLAQVLAFVVCAVLGAASASTGQDQGLPSGQRARLILETPLHMSSCGVWVDADAGMWPDATEPSKDRHVIPLGFAWEWGACRWNQEKRDEFASDPDNHLDRDFGRRRDMPPSEWLPKKGADAYLKRWALLVDRYDLSVPEEVTALLDLASRVPSQE